MNNDRHHFQFRLMITVVGLTVIFRLSAWMVCSDSTVYRWLMRLYTDREFMHDVLHRWGMLAPLVFVVIQALQVIIAPIPGDVAERQLRGNNRERPTNTGVNTVAAPRPHQTPRAEF